MRHPGNWRNRNRERILITGERILTVTTWKEIDHRWNAIYHLGYKSMTTSEKIRELLSLRRKGVTIGMRR